MSFDVGNYYPKQVEIHCLMMTLFILGKPAGNHEETHPDWVPIGYMWHTSTPGLIDHYLWQQKNNKDLKRRKEQDEDTSYSELF